jgi:tubulin delta
MSLAGGTGSGVGSYYTEIIRDYYPRSCIINTCVWPYSNGEVVLQNYNFLLTLNKIYECSDGVIVMENDNLHQICSRLGNGGLNDKKNNNVTFNDLNEVIAHKLACVFQPSSDTNGNSNYSNEIITDLCPNNDYKLLCLSSVPYMSKRSIEFSSFQWTGLYRHAKQLLFTDDQLNLNQNEINKSISLSLFARGQFNTNETLVDITNSTFDNFFQQKYLANRDWRPSNGLVNLWSQKRPFNKYEKSLTILSNSQMPVYKIDRLVDKAWRMFSSKAYIHHYTKYGNFDEEQLLNAFIFAEQLVKNYKKI